MKKNSTWCVQRNIISITHWCVTWVTMDLSCIWSSPCLEIGTMEEWYMIASFGDMVSYRALYTSRARKFTYLWWRDVMERVSVRDSVCFDDKPRWTRRNLLSKFWIFSQILRYTLEILLNVFKIINHTYVTNDFDAKYSGKCYCIFLF